MENNQTMKRQLLSTFIFLLLAFPLCRLSAQVEQASIGAVKTTFDVNKMGAAVYSVKIEAPAGGKLVPEIGLVYNSQSGNGLAGYGFNISGISSITRGKKDLFHDGEIRGTRYDDRDALYLDGVRLILKDGTEGKEGAIYCPESNPYLKVILHKDCSTADCWFSAEAPNGLHYEYGHNPDARLSFTSRKGAEHTSAWYVDHINNQYSDHIRFYYAAGSNYCFRPTQIVYGNNGVKDRGINNKIEFDYADIGNNAVPFIIGDRQGLIDKRLATITTSTNGQVYRKYSLFYNDESDGSHFKFSRLARIEEANGKGDKLNPVSIGWNYLPSHEIPTAKIDLGSLAGYGKDKAFIAMDLNNDGISDILQLATSGSSRYLYIHYSSRDTQGNVTFSKVQSIQVDADFDEGIAKKYLQGIHAMDFDGDGLNDLIFPTFNVVHGIGQIRIRFIFGNKLLNGNVQTVNVASEQLKASQEPPLFTMFDIYGDGRDDIIYVEKKPMDNVYPGAILSSSRSGYSQTENIDLTFDGPPQKMFRADFNNDGLIDKIFFYRGGYKIYFNQGGKKDASHFSESSTFKGNTFGDCFRIEQGDFNGDGLADFIYYVGDTYYNLAINNGNGTFSIKEKILDLEGMYNKEGETADDDKFNIMIYDIDHDGRSDVVLTCAHYEKSKSIVYIGNEYKESLIKWVYSDPNTSFSVARTTTITRSTDTMSNNLLIGDFNGDGYAELAGYGCDLYTGNASETDAIHVYSSGGDMTEKGKVSVFFDSFGNRTAISYKPATNPGVCTTEKDNGSSYPVNSYAIPISLVSQVLAGNGEGDAQRTDYRYENLKVHIGGKGVLGFAKTMAENITADTKYMSEIRKWDNTRWIPTQVLSTTMMGDRASTNTETFIVQSYNSGNYFIYINRRDTKDFDGNITTEYTDYNTDKGVPENITTNYGGNSGMYKQISYSDYVQKSGVWLPGRIEKKQKHIHDTEVFAQATLLTYDDKGNILSETANEGSPLSLTTYYTYDTYGNIISKKKEGKGIKENTENFKYDSTGRFLSDVSETGSPASTSYTYDIWGNRLTENDNTDKNNVLTTKYEYDGWGNENKETLPDGTIITTSMDWGISQGQKYFLLTTPSNAPWTKTWYDSYGREVQTETVGAADIMIRTGNSYDIRGNITEMSSQTGNLLTWKKTTYDELNRPLSDILSSGKNTTYTYGNRSITRTMSGRTTAETMDAWGNVVKATDPTSEVNYKYSSNGKPSSVTAAGVTTYFEYDDVGNKISMEDPDAGYICYAYAADGKTLSRTDARGIVTRFTYDADNRLIMEETGSTVTRHIYGTSGTGRNRLVRSIMGGNSVEYTYDKLGRVANEKRTFGDKGTFEFKYSYDAQGLPTSVTYPGGVTLSYGYDAYGNKTYAEANSKKIYELEDYDGLRTTTSFLDKIYTERTLDEWGFERNVRLYTDSKTIENFAEQFDRPTGNMISRQRNQEKKELFSYDPIDRLVSVKENGIEKMAMSYSANGNISFKTGLGNFSYDTMEHPHAVTGVENSQGKISLETLETSFNEIGKIGRIRRGASGYDMAFSYGPDHERWYSCLTRNGKQVRSTIYAGNYEKITEGDLTREYYYTDGNTILVKTNGKLNYYQAFVDNLGSILSVVDEEGDMVFGADYDAWGKQNIRQNMGQYPFGSAVRPGTEGQTTSPGYELNYIGLQRGYCGHEMISEFLLINMNGRLYDPVLGRFLSPDNYVQESGNSQNFNRYSYCLNNPLKYIDPSGEFWNLIIGAAIGGIFNWASHGFNFNAKGIGYFVTGALAGAVGTGMTSGVSVALAGGNFWAGAAGLTGGVSSTGFLAGAAAGGSAGFASGIISGMGNAWIDGNSFYECIRSGLNSGWIDGLTGGVAEGIIGGLKAVDIGTNFWTGKTQLSTVGAYSCSGCLPSHIDIGENTITGKYVGTFENQYIFESSALGNINGDYYGVTIPERGIIVGKGVFTGGKLRGLAMIQHEFGHILQYREIGPKAYWTVVAPESLIDCATRPKEHYRYWTETWANFLSQKYFGNKWIRSLQYPAKNISFINQIKINMAIFGDSFPFGLP